MGAVYRSKSPSVPQSSTNDARVTASVFDPVFYGQKNPDLAANGLTSSSQLETHWLNHGIDEGRQASSRFSSKEYLGFYGDLGAAGLDTPGQALEHWLSNGRDEGRVGASDAYLDDQVFDPEFYASFNPNLAAMGVETDAQLREHWVRHGAAEGRQGSADFDAQWYLDRYPDLRSNGVTTPAAALQHFHEKGRTEGRAGSSLARDVVVREPAVAGDGHDEGLKMDVYRPSQPGQGPIPVVINLVGGGWQSSDTSHPVMINAGQTFAEHGMAVLTPSYRTAPDVRYPEMMQDVTSMLEYLRDNAAENGWDLANVTLMGGSAGAHLALQHAMNPEYDGQSDLPSVKNVIAVAPPTDLTVDVANDDFAENDAGEQMVDALLGLDVDASEAERLAAKVEASPISYAGEESNGDKRFYVAYGEIDGLTVPSQQVLPFIEAMTEAGQDLTVQSFAEGGHGDFQNPSSDVYDPTFVHGLAQWILEG